MEHKRQNTLMPFAWPYTNINKPRNVCYATLLLVTLTSALLISCGGGSDRGPSQADDNSQPQSSDTVTFEPTPIRMRSMLSWQYKNTVGDLLGSAAKATIAPLEDTVINGSSSIGAATIALSPVAIESYEKNAFAATQAALKDPVSKAKLITCNPTSITDDSCLTTVIGNFGRRAYRRSLTSDEIISWKKVAMAAANAYSSFDRGVEFAVAGILQSPQFLYLSEQGESDPQRPGILRYTGQEMASRLSYALIGTTPPDSLIAAAQAGKLSTADGIRAEARKLLDMPQALDAMKVLFSEWLALNELSTVGKDASLYPSYNSTLANLMKEETLRVLGTIATDSKRNFLDIFDANFTYIDKTLASHYNMPAPSGSDFTYVDLPASGPRAGVLTQAAFLSAMAHPVDTSPTLRGKLIRERVLCETVSSPPDDVVTSLTPKPGAPAMTMRQRLQEHLSQSSCASCHKLMDPIGLGFEHFDAVGRYRTTDRGLTIDASGNLDTVGNFKDARTLAALLKNDPRVAACITRVVFRHIAAHIETQGEQSTLQQIEKNVRERGFNFRTLLVEQVASDAFRYAKP
jgi:hypothetical protein